MGGQHCCIKWRQSIFILGIKGHIWKGTEPCAVAAIILDLLQRCHLCSSWLFVWRWNGLMDKSVKNCTLSFYFYRVTTHLRITYSVGSMVFCGLQLSLFLRLRELKQIKGALTLYAVSVVHFNFNPTSIPIHSTCTWTVFDLFSWIELTKASVSSLLSENFSFDDFKFSYCRKQSFLTFKCLGVSMPTLPTLTLN